MLCSILQTQSASLRHVAVSCWKSGHRDTAPTAILEEQARSDQGSSHGLQTPGRLIFPLHTAGLAGYVSDSMGELAPGDIMQKALSCVALTTGLNGKRKYLQDHWLCCVQPRPQFLDPCRICGQQCLQTWGKPTGPIPAHSIAWTCRAPVHPWLWERTELQFLFVLMSKDTNDRAYSVSYKG